MKSTLLALSLVCSLVGCSKKSDEAGGSAGGAGGAGGADACESAVGKAIDAMTGGASKRPDAPAQMVEISNKLRGVMVSRCKADSWPKPVLDCYAAATDMPSIRKCRMQLPPEQAQKLQGEIMSVMGGGMRPGGPGGPGGPGMGGGMPPGHSGMSGMPPGPPPSGDTPAGGGSGAAPAGSAAPAAGSGSAATK